MKSKNNRSAKMSDTNINFWKKLNINCIKADKMTEIISYSDIQEYVVKYFRLNNDRYLELISTMEVNNNVS